MKPSIAEKNDLVGTWTGETQPVVDWVEAREIPVTLTIHRSGEISGRVGDADIVGGIVKPGRGWVLKMLGWGREFVAKAMLQGFIIEAENIRRDRVNILFDIEDNELRGGLHSSGSKIGDRKTMRLSTRAMILRRRPSASGSPPTPPW